MVRMKRLICILLIGWLPCFSVVAQAMALQMQTQEFVDNQQSMMACHEHGDQGQSDHKTLPETHRCQVCGFCVVTSGVADIDFQPQISTQFSAAGKLPLFAAVFHSLTYPPAIKPPILA